MPIYEKEPRIKVGPFRIGTRPGRQLSKGDPGVTLIESSGNDPFRGGQVESGMFVNLVRQDTVVVTAWSEDDIYGPVQTTAPGEITAEAINKHPLLKRKLVYIP